jgi:hypothetical protein
MNKVQNINVNSSGKSAYSLYSSFVTDGVKSA